MLENLVARLNSGITVLGIGLALLIFTFISAYLFLNEGLQIVTSQDFAQTFGDALAPLIATCIRIMYLGVMGWIGSIVTIRGVAIMSNNVKPSITAQNYATAAHNPKTQSFYQQTQSNLSVENVDVAQPQKSMPKLKPQ